VPLPHRPSCWAEHAAGRAPKQLLMWPGRMPPSASAHPPPLASRTMLHCPLLLPPHPRACLPQMSLVPRFRLLLLLHAQISSPPGAVRVFFTQSCVQLVSGPCIATRKAMQLARQCARHAAAAVLQRAAASRRRLHDLLTSAGCISWRRHPLPHTQHPHARTSCSIGTNQLQHWHEERHAASRTMGGTSNKAIAELCLPGCMHCAGCAPRARATALRRAACGGARHRMLTAHATSCHVLS